MRSNEQAERAQRLFSRCPLRTICTFHDKEYDSDQLRQEQPASKFTQAARGDPHTNQATTANQQREKTMDGSKESLRLLDMDKGSNSEGLDTDSTRRHWVESLKGILAAFCNVISHITGVTSIQLLERRVPELELQVFRCIAIVTFCLLWIFCHHQSPSIPVLDRSATILYVSVVSLETTAIYMGFALTPASAAQCAMTTVSMLCGLFIFGLCGKEKIGPVKVIFALLCTAGVILVIQPWHGHEHDQHESASAGLTNHSMQTTKKAKLLLFNIPQVYLSTTGVIITGFGGSMYTVLTVVIKQNPCLSEYRFRSLFWAFGTCLVCSLLVTFILENSVLPENLFDIIAITVHCVTSVSSWFCLVYAMQHTSGTTASIILSSAVVLFLIPQYTILASILPGNKNWMEVVGVCMVLMGSISGSLYEMSHPPEGD